MKSLAVVILSIATIISSTAAQGGGNPRPRSSNPIVPPPHNSMIATGSDDRCVRAIMSIMNANRDHMECNLDKPSSKTPKDAALSWDAKKIPGSDSSIRVKDDKGVVHLVNTFRVEHRCDAVTDVGYCRKNWLKQQLVGIFEQECPDYMVNTLPKTSGSENQKSVCVVPPKVDSKQLPGTSASGRYLYCKDGESLI